MDKMVLERVNVRLRQRKVAKIHHSFLIAYGGFILIGIGLIFTMWVAEFWSRLFSLISQV